MGTSRHRQATATVSNDQSFVGPLAATHDKGEHDTHDEHDPTYAERQFKRESYTRVSCQACRKKKSRCVLQPGTVPSEVPLEGDKRCKRCIKLNLECVVWSGRFQTATNKQAWIHRATRRGSPGVREPHASPSAFSPPPSTSRKRKRAESSMVASPAPASAPPSVPEYPSTSWVAAPDAASYAFPDALFHSDTWVQPGSSGAFHQEHAYQPTDMLPPPPLPSQYVMGPPMNGSAFAGYPHWVTSMWPDGSVAQGAQPATPPPPPPPPSFASSAGPREGGTQGTTVSMSRPPHLVSEHSTPAVGTPTLQQPVHDTTWDGMVPVNSSLDLGTVTKPEEADTSWFDHAMESTHDWDAATTQAAAPSQTPVAAPAPQPSTTSFYPTASAVTAPPELFWSEAVRLVEQDRSPKAEEQDKFQTEKQDHLRLSVEPDDRPQTVPQDKSSQAIKQDEPIANEEDNLPQAIEPPAPVEITGNSTLPAPEPAVDPVMKQSDVQSEDQESTMLDLLGLRPPPKLKWALDFALNPNVTASDPGDARQLETSLEQCATGLYVLFPSLLPWSTIRALLESVHTSAPTIWATLVLHAAIQSRFLILPPPPSELEPEKHESQKSKKSSRKRPKKPTRSGERKSKRLKPGHTGDAAEGEGADADGDHDAEHAEHDPQDPAQDKSHRQDDPPADAETARSVLQSVLGQLGALLRAEVPVFLDQHTTKASWTASNAFHARDQNRSDDGTSGANESQINGISANSDPSPGPTRVPGSKVGAQGAVASLCTAQTLVLLYTWDPLAHGSAQQNDEQMPLYAQSRVPQVFGHETLLAALKAFGLVPTHPSAQETKLLTTGKEAYRGQDMYNQLRMLHLAELQAVTIHVFSTDDLGAASTVPARAFAQARGDLEPSDVGDQASPAAEQLMTWARKVVDAARKRTKKEDDDAAKRAAATAALPARRTRQADAKVQAKVQGVDSEQPPSQPVRLQPHEEVLVLRAIGAWRTAARASTAASVLQETKEIKSMWERASALKFQRRRGRPRKNAMYLPRGAKSDPTTHSGSVTLLQMAHSDTIPGFHRALKKLNRDFERGKTHMRTLLSETQLADTPLGILSQSLWSLAEVDKHQGLVQITAPVLVLFLRHPAAVTTQSPVLAQAYNRPHRTSRVLLEAEERLRRTLVKPPDPVETRENLEHIHETRSIGAWNSFQVIMSLAARNLHCPDGPPQPTQASTPLVPLGALVPLPTLLSNAAVVVKHIVEEHVVHAHVYADKGTTLPDAPQLQAELQLLSDHLCLPLYHPTTSDDSTSKSYSQLTQSTTQLLHRLGSTTLGLTRISLSLPRKVHHDLMEPFAPWDEQLPNALASIVPEPLEPGRAQDVLRMVLGPSSDPISTSRAPVEAKAKPEESAAKDRAPPEPSAPPTVSPSTRFASSPSVAPPASVDPSVITDVQFTPANTEAPPAPPEVDPILAAMLEIDPTQPVPPTAAPTTSIATTSIATTEPIDHPIGPPQQPEPEPTSTTQDAHMDSVPTDPALEPEADAPGNQMDDKVNKEVAERDVAMRAQADKAIQSAARDLNLLAALCDDVPDWGRVLQLAQQQNP